jgi:hypothetical protein
MSITAVATISSTNVKPGADLRAHFMSSYPNLRSSDLRTW